MLHAVLSPAHRWRPERTAAFQRMKWEEKMMILSLKNMDLASKKYRDLNNLSILKHEKRSWFTVTMKRIDIPCKTGSAATRNGDFFPNNLGFRQPKRGIQPSAISEGIHHLRTLWCRASADQPATERSPGRRLDVFGGKNSIGNHGFYSTFVYILGKCAKNRYATMLYDTCMIWLCLKWACPQAIWKGKWWQINGWNGVPGQHMGMGPGVYGCSSQHQKKAFIGVDPSPHSSSDFFLDRSLSIYIPFGVNTFDPHGVLWGTPTINLMMIQLIRVIQRRFMKLI